MLDLLNFRPGQTVLWHSAKGYTPPEGEYGVIDAIWPEKGCVRLTLDAPDAPPEFGGKCSMIAYFSELSVVAMVPQKSQLQQAQDTRDVPASTAGPWQHGVEFDTGAYPMKRVIAVRISGCVVAHVNCGFGNGPANAALIAAAPELLAALHNMAMCFGVCDASQDWWANIHDDYVPKGLGSEEVRRDTLDAAHKAIAKARGA